MVVDLGCLVELVLVVLRMELKLPVIRPSNMGIKLLLVKEGWPKIYKIFGFY